ncbi:hypothetical protein OS493_038450 [Desmophyllum pertusum]|uniref:Uncharacterized protein n=1 Tax=Desmophyllum pertusum TaxID=174260 RepID=A0A9W9Z8C4_9CNID|nr:hypothetical protein OS493_038450 [Desmophyllum pertusum]
MGDPTYIKENRRPNQNDYIKGTIDESRRKLFLFFTRLMKRSHYQSPRIPYGYKSQGLHGMYQTAQDQQYNNTLKELHIRAKDLCSPTQVTCQPREHQRLTKPTQLKPSARSAPGPNASAEQTFNKRFRANSSHRCPINRFLTNRGSLRPPPDYPSQSAPQDYYAQSLTQPSATGYSSFSRATTNGLLPATCCSLIVTAVS